MVLRKDMMLESLVIDSLPKNDQLPLARKTSPKPWPLEIKVPLMVL